MKIIKTGRDSRRIRRVTCQHCEAVFEFGEKEARFAEDTREGNALIVKCPSCNRDLWISTSVPLVEGPRP